MVTAKTVIANMALGHLGSGKEIGNLETENSAEARALRRFFEPAKREMLRAFDWSFARRRVELGLSDETPTDEWAYAYRLPADCLAVRRIPSGTRNDTRQSRVPYSLGQDASGPLIFTDRQDAEVVYTADNDAVQWWPADFVMAHSYKLAALAAPSITGSDRAGLRELCMQLHLLAGQSAMANALNEEQPDESPESEFIRARGEFSSTWMDVGPRRDG